MKFINIYVMKKETWPKLIAYYYQTWNRKYLNIKQNQCVEGVGKRSMTSGVNQEFPRLDKFNWKSVIYQGPHGNL